MCSCAYVILSTIHCQIMSYNSELSARQCCFYAQYVGTPAVSTECLHSNQCSGCVFSRRANALVAECVQIPASMFQNHIESLHKSNAANTAAYYCPWLWNGDVQQTHKACCKSNIKFQQRTKPENHRADLKTKVGNLINEMKESK